jgi:hypothetical protein
MENKKETPKETPKEKQIKKKTPLQRYAELKAEIRSINLEKEEPGYKSRYFFVALQTMQNIFVKLELKHGLTSIYSEVTRESVNQNFEPVYKTYAVRELIDLETEQIVVNTRIDITNLKQLQDPFQIKEEILRISEPLDAWKTLYLDFFEPQNLGAISTYFQRYTYNQLYDFQETKADTIEEKGRIKGEPVVEKKPKKKEETPKEKRLKDESKEIRKKIKDEFEREDIVKQLQGRRLSTMTKEEAINFYEEMIEQKVEKEPEKIENEEI